MSQGLQFFTPFSRTFDGPLDVSVVFDTLGAMNQYLSHEARYAGQIVSCKQAEGSIFVLSNDRSQWLVVSAGQTADKHFNISVTHSMQEIIQHNLGKKPAVQIISPGNEKVIADVEHMDENTTKVTFIDYFTGTVIFN